jgi:hypothetical protein
VRAYEPVLASPAAPASFGALLAHLFSCRFAHQLIYPFLRRGLPMALARGIDWSTTGARSRGRCLLRRSLARRRALAIRRLHCFRLVSLRGLTHCHESPLLGIFPIERRLPALTDSAAASGLPANDGNPDAAIVTMEVRIACVVWHTMGRYVVRRHFGTVACPRCARTSAALLDSTVRVHMLVAGPPFASFPANTT